MPVYRVFPHRYYIDVLWFDIVADNPKNASRAAKAVAKQIRPDARATAVDNHWQTDEPVVVSEPGIAAGGPHPMTLVAKTKYGNVYQAGSNVVPLPRTTEGMGDDSVGQLLDLTEAMAINDTATITELLLNDHPELLQLYAQIGANMVELARRAARARGINLKPAVISFMFEERS